jgi:archaemetzincin
MTAMGIQIIALGEMDGEVLEGLASRITPLSGLGCRPLIFLERPDFAYNREREQFNAQKILSFLLEHYPNPSSRILGITGVDLYLPIFTYVFGLAQVGGRGAVVSSYRLDPHYYGMPAHQDLFRCRLEKTVLHEIAHLLGLTHCRNRYCVLFSSSGIEDTDQKKAEFCPTCKTLFKWTLDGI